MKGNMDTDTIQGDLLDNQVTGDGNIPESTPNSENQPTGQEQIEAPSDQGDEIDLETSDLKDRTKQYIERLKAEKRELEAKLKSVPTEPVIDMFQEARNNMPVVDQNFNNFDPTASVMPNQQQFVDEYGNFDVNGFNLAMKQINDRVYLAEVQAQRSQAETAKFRETQQEREALAAYPSLDPTNKEAFDRDFRELVVSQLTVELIKNPNATVKGVADKLSQIYKPAKPIDVAKVKESAVEEYKQTQQLRNQGPIEQGSGQSRNPIDNLDELREKTRRGDSDALEARMKSIGLIK